MLGMCDSLICFLCVCVFVCVGGVVGVLVFVNARFFGVAPTEAFVPYLQTSGSPFTVVHGAYESLEIAITHTVFPFIAVAFVAYTLSSPSY